MHRFELRALTRIAASCFVAILAGAAFASLGGHRPGRNKPSDIVGLAFFDQCSSEQLLESRSIELLRKNKIKFGVVGSSISETILVRKGDFARARTSLLHTDWGKQLHFYSQPQSTGKHHRDRSESTHN